MVSLTVPGCVHVLVVGVQLAGLRGQRPPPRIDGLGLDEGLRLRGLGDHAGEGEGEHAASRGFVRASSCNGTLWPLRPRFRVFAHGADASFDTESS